jgi:hypothetical protein
VAAGQVCRGGTQVAAGQRAILNFTPGGQLRPWGPKFTPRGEVKNGPQVGVVHLRGGVMKQDGCYVSIGGYVGNIAVAMLEKDCYVGNCLKV